MGRKVFYSFHYGADVMRVQIIRNMGVVDGDAPVMPNVWEEVKRRGIKAIQNWIDNAMLHCSCVVVLIGQYTYRRRWVKYEIEHAWNTGKGLLGVYIHDLAPVNDNLASRGVQGENPFSEFQLRSHDELLLSMCVQESPKRLDSVVPIMLPNKRNAYRDIKDNLSYWVERAIEVRKNYEGYECEKTKQAIIASSIWGK